ncbi:MAG: PilZ domain-containing protein [Mesorhizobium sp.]|nr:MULTISPECIES: PilZ domain-containing protein [unclassified Mesorhizobium]TGV93316.1 PilZ domain-containing protein [Mesorhizobium sp. M00.F.Ca.ET.158.01.1.1]WIE94281.1 PilZ domain-containing protein [Mesorhizobium sp. WSM4875]AZO62358.1 PilZ domain-containing protein [Mesorhizobium sp. M1A.F.Ca.IN.022.06.1.1]MCT2577300.1 PilZ domain-containing protein [Mesorhizobium sp. P13.3]MDF3166238.1 PilZ domain-containing protein [Mesorhizobium sp. P16.1]
MTENELRGKRRQRVLKGAAILTGINNSGVMCTVRNMHPGGAELKLPIEAHVPDEFLLYVTKDRIGYKAIVRWRRDDRIGVEFAGTEPKPHWHYG